MGQSSRCLQSSAEQGQPRRLTTHVDKHLAMLVERMTEGLLAASTAADLEAMMELMRWGTVELLGLKGKHDPKARQCAGSDKGW
jgi:hypothetical protein